MNIPVEILYGIKVDSTQPMEGGQTSNTIKITNARRQYVLKSHATIDLAHNEFLCLDALSLINMTPKPIKTLDGSLCFRWEDSYYILMEYVLAERLGHCIIDYFALGKNVRRMHRKLCSIELTNVNDRFNECHMIENLENKKIQEVITGIKMPEVEDNTESIIHGDLGFWNILLNDEDFYFIDFGETMLSDCFFDLAAIVESLDLNEANIHQLLRGYGPSDPSAYSRLMKMRYRWKYRGALYLAVNDLVGEERMIEILKEISLFSKEVELSKNNPYRAWSDVDD
ncbi:phosphotransferase [Salinicoccus sesuvii]|uniref:Phosphotransferase n=1 Tax=Salinicoccus sesuvii TaxID=868281 RepID=A0ABV7N4U7_9STAP